MVYFLAQVVETSLQTSQLVQQQTLVPLQQVNIILQQEIMLYAKTQQDITTTAIGGSALI
jgi:hypothetical protein